MAQKAKAADAIIAKQRNIAGDLGVPWDQQAKAAEVVAVKKQRGLRVSFNSPVILTFALISLLALGLGYLPGDITRRLFSVYRSPFTDWLTYPRFFLHVLGHANLSHYVSNLMLLLVLGPPLEAHYGSRTLVEIIAIVALVSGLVNFIFFPGAALLGASGVVFAFIVLASMIGMRHGTIPLTMIFAVLLWIGTEVWNMIFVTNNVSELTHIIGGAVGAALGFALARRFRDTTDGRNSKQLELL
ncbi:MAG: rhomboid family intramembrane serine protease [Cellulomonadaceae bacterium]|jgi:GlpG protein|nr:rhomboid family intramembrane serine protease [Cellulomonadaceae bacterium]